MASTESSCIPAKYKLRILQDLQYENHHRQHKRHSSSQSTTQHSKLIQSKDAQSAYHFLSRPLSSTGNDPGTRQRTNLHDHHMVIEAQRGEDTQTEPAGSSTQIS